MPKDFGLIGAEGMLSLQRQVWRLVARKTSILHWRSFTIPFKGCLQIEGETRRRQVLMSVHVVRDAQTSPRSWEQPILGSEGVSIAFE
jgi:hypothetical protein